MGMPSRHYRRKHLESESDDFSDTESEETIGSSDTEEEWETEESEEYSSEETGSEEDSDEEDEEDSDEDTEDSSDSSYVPKKKRKDDDKIDSVFDARLLRRVGVVVIALLL